MDWSVIADTDYTPVLHPEGAIDQLHFLLGSTLDANYITHFGETFDAISGGMEGDVFDFTLGIIGDDHATGFVYRALINDNDKYTLFADFTHAREATTQTSRQSLAVGSYLVRDILTPVPVPAAVWLMGSGLLGFLGYSRHRKPTIAA